jgi:hypothetical protein
MFLKKEVARIAEVDEMVKKESAEILNRSEPVFLRFRNDFIQDPDPTFRDVPNPHPSPKYGGVFKY